MYYRGTRHEARGTFALSRSLTQLLLPQLRVCVGVCVVCVCVKVHSKCVSLFANCNHCCCCAANETKVKATSFARVQLSHKIPCKVVKEISIKTLFNDQLHVQCCCSPFYRVYVTNAAVPFSDCLSDSMKSACF